MCRALGVRAFFFESERPRIEDLACQDPTKVDWETTHWPQRN